LPIFQKSVLNSIKYDEALIASRWNNFQNYLSKVQAIRGFKEEVYQDGFFKDVFESCLGYTLKTTNPADYNLEREKKNETDGKKADGVIYVNGEIIGIVELKDQKTKNLDAVESQAFNYHNSHSNSKYIIISNFDELRFYIDKKTAYEKFNLFSLSYEDFKTLHLLLSYESIRDDIPLKLKEKSANFEATISKQLYKDFSAFRTHLFENIVKNNYLQDPPVRGELVEPQHPSTSSGRTELDKQTLLRLTQKLCDRVIFILFAEDRNLLKANTIKEIREYFKNQAFTTYALYDIYKFYFDAINRGNEKLSIPKYNGGLFAKDELLDSLIIDDSALDVEAQKLSDYDFESDISVNILGHIFEQSLTDLEELNASIENTNFDKKKSKRKKDGVFYTPEYITHYIVENTLGKLCTDKKEELKIESETVVVNPRKLTKQEQSYKEILLNYREWLTHLKILDPACGSGAFLNQALEFLISEHTFIRDLLLPFQDLTLRYEIEKDILEHNLYGVDINEDAVEIAKLSLWLRTAHKGRELTSLNDKIICANSLLAMPFEENSFDVVIGNPPYGASFDAKDKKIIAQMYSEIYKGKFDSYHFFTYLGIKLLKENGLLGYIIPDTWTILQQTEKLREFILKYFIESIEKYNFNVFEDANIDTLSIIIKNLAQVNEMVQINLVDKNYNKTSQFVSQIRFLNSDGFVFNYGSDEATVNLIEKIRKEKLQIKDYCEVSAGIQAYSAREMIPIYGIEKTKQIMDERAWHSDYKKDETYKMELEGKDISKYELEWNGKNWISYGDWLVFPRPQKYFTMPRLLVQRIRNPKLKIRIVATYTDEEYYNNPALSNFISKTNDINELKYILSILNSKMINWVYANSFNDVNIKPTDLELLPIPEISTISHYQTNITTLMAMPKKTRYDKETKIAVASYDGKDIYLTEFLFAKNRGYIEELRGHSEFAMNYFKLLPYIFMNIEEVYLNLQTGRDCHIFTDNTGKKIIHVIDTDGSLVSIHANREKEFERFKKKAELKKSNLQGSNCAHFSILSPAGATFWRQASLIEELYTHFSKNTLTQDDFIIVVDEILTAKETLKKYKKHFDSLNAIDKIEIKEATEKLEARVVECEKEIDKMVYVLYALSADEIGIVEGKK
jgi:type I restriction-modification system DNA methylase subunit